MKKIILYVSLLLITIFLGRELINLSSIDSANEHSSLEKEGEEEGDKLQNIGDAIQQEFEKTKDPELNIVPRERLLKANEILKQRRTQKAAIPGLVWQERGPNNVGGRTRAIWVDENNSNRIITASVGGGLFITTDFFGERTWKPIDDFFANLAITSIAQQGNTDIMYFGTGEGWFNFDAIRGMGIWKSCDRGETWEQLTSTNNSNFNNVQTLLVDNEGVVYAATRAGVQRSTDGGKSWTKVLGASVSGGVNDDAADLDISANGVVYASFGILSTGALYKSSTGEVGSWTDITPTGAGGFQRIEIGASPTNTNRVYILCQGAGTNDATYIGRSDSQGNGWTSLPIPDIIDQESDPADRPPFTRGQAWYDLVLKVHPALSNIVYIGGIDGLRSIDGGNNWTQITTWSLASATGYTAAQMVHADHHQITFFPGINPNSAIWGTDGGLYYSSNIKNTSGYPSFTAANTNYNVTQYYSCALHPTAGMEYFLGGTQDNGTQKFTSAGMNSTTNVSGGDGGFCHIDQDNPNIQIVSFTRNNYRISTNGGTSFVDGPKVNTGIFINPTDYDDEANKLYGSYSAGNYFRWNNPGSGNSWDAVSVTEFTEEVNGDDVARTVTHVATSPNVDDRVYFGLNNGRIVRVNDAHTGTSKSGTILTPRTNGSVSGIAIEEGDEDHLLVSYSNYGITSIYESTNGGSNWSQVEGNLPDMPVRWIMFNPLDEDQALIATELGVWSTDDLKGSTTNWQPASTSFPNVRTDMLQYRSSDNILIAATHGRGMFSSKLYSPSTRVVNFATATSETTETPNGFTAGCGGPNFGARRINIPVNLSAAPTNTTIVAVSIDPSSEVTQGRDVFLITPTLTFASGSTTQNVVFDIFDDSSMEEEEELIININVSSGPAVTGILKQHKVTIIDNDNEPDEDIPVTILEEDWEGTITSGSDNNSANNHNVWVFTTSACGNKIDNITALIVNRNDAGNLVCGYGSYSESNHLWKTIDATNKTDLHVKFDWIATGENIGSTLYDYGTLVYSTNTSTPSWTAVPDVPRLLNSNGVQTLAATLPASLDDQVFLLGWRWQADFSQVNSPPLGIDNIKVTGRAIPKVETTLKSTNSLIYAGEVAHFYSSDGKIIASLEATGGSSLGCVTVSIDDTGTGKQAITNIDEVTDKTFFIEGSDAPYELTLYFTAAELDVWGSEKLSLNIVKTDGAVTTDGSPEVIQSFINPDIDVTTYEDGDFIRYVYRGTTLGGFALTNADNALAIDLLDFTATTQSDGIQLQWSTLTEVQNDHFILERSTDNLTFEPLTKVAAVGNTAKESNYDYLDTKPTAGTNYYRLNPVSTSNQLGAATIATAEFEVASGLMIFPNPIATGQKLQVELATLNASRAVMEILDDSGRSIQQRSLKLQKGLNQFQPSIDDLAVGTYIVRITTKDREWVKQFVKI
ncbi:MAG: T9SS type A sorting domain-containing protein [Saprospiraceae bacterium]